MLESTAVTCCFSRWVKNRTATFLMGSGTGRMAGFCSSCSYSSICAWMASGRSFSLRAASNAGATVASVSPGATGRET